ncbi:hypothetical protein C0J52_15013 [Blattella germanica]|nr:hypothetical protein C0J52_15013 [Blattella germanica]
MRKTLSESVVHESATDRGMTTQTESDEDSNLTTDCRNALTDKYCWGMLCLCLLIAVLCYGIFLLTVFRLEGGKIPIAYDDADIAFDKPHFFRSYYWSRERLKLGKRLRHPVRFVVVSQTGTSACHSLKRCMADMRQLLRANVTGVYPDIGYNFVVGGDGNDDEPTPEQLEALEELIELGVNSRKISPSYKLVPRDGALFLGKHLHKEMTKWPNYWEESTGFCE